MVPKTEVNAPGAVSMGDSEVALSVEESRDSLDLHVQSLTASASQSGNHVDCILGAGLVLGAVIPLVNAMDVVPIGGTRFASYHSYTFPHPVPPAKFDSDLPGDSRI
jgi:hypothetical protein